MSPFPERLAQTLRELVPGYPEARLCIAFSGGADSTALLRAACELARGEAALTLRAVHVDHGLQAASAAWAGHCESVCAALGVPLEVIRLALEPGRDESVEARARAGRYVALAAVLGKGECLLTAHHADDQLETVLIQLFRGAGLKGLAAMPRRAALGRGMHLRPLLDVRRRELVDYAAGAGLRWIEDPMNADLRFDRGYLRQRVLPAIRERWPSVARTVRRSAAHLAEAQQVTAALAALDAGVAPGDGRLPVAVLARLPRERQANLLRWWLASCGLGMPPAARLDAILHDLLPARRDAMPVVAWRDGEVRRYRSWLYAMPPLGPPPPEGWQRAIAPGETVELPRGLGSLSLEPVVGEGLAVDATAGRLTVAFRSGGERLSPGPGRPVRTLKNLLQEAGVVPWMRQRLPLLFGQGGQLVAVPGLWVAEGLGCGPGRRGVVARWRVSPSTSSRRRSARPCR